MQNACGFYQSINVDVNEFSCLDLSRVQENLCPASHVELGSRYLLETLNAFAATSCLSADCEVRDNSCDSVQNINTQKDLRLAACQWQSCSSTKKYRLSRITWDGALRLCRQIELVNAHATSQSDHLHVLLVDGSLPCKKYHWLKSTLLS